MKKIYILAVATILSATAFAQFDTIGSNSDYLPAYDPSNSGATPFTTPGQGFAFGTNVFGSHIAQGYLNLNSNAFNVVGALITTHYATAHDTTSFMVVGIHRNDPAASYTNAPTTPKILDNGPKTPAELLDTIFIKNIPDLDQNVAVSRLLGFANPVSFTSLDTFIYISVDMTDVKAKGDTISIGSNAGTSLDLNFVFSPVAGIMSYIPGKLLGGSLAQRIIGLRIIVDITTGVEESDFVFNNIKLTNYPNPAINTTTISYELIESMNNVKFTLYDATGRQVINLAKGNQAKGTYNFDLDVSSYDAGNYFYSIEADGFYHTRKFIITK